MLTPNILDLIFSEIIAIIRTDTGQTDRREQTDRRTWLDKLV